MNQLQVVEWWSDAKKHLKRDEHLGPFVKEFAKEGLRCKGDLFYTICRSIVGQQISVAAADTIWGRLETAAKRIQPKAVLKLDEPQLRAIGLSRMKASYLLGIADAMSEFRKIDWDDLDDEAAISRLVELRGVGRWTAEMVLIFTFARQDILPLGDIGLIRAAEKNLYKRKPRDLQASQKRLEKMARQWRPYRTAATWYLWRTIDPVTVEY